MKISKGPSWQAAKRFCRRKITSHLRSYVRTAEEAACLTMPSCSNMCNSISFASLKGVLFDIDGTLTNSDPLHFKAFQEYLSEVGFQNGKLIDDEFFRKHISGRSNPEIAKDLFPSWSLEERTQFSAIKEARYRKMAESSLEPLNGLLDFLSWIDKQGLRKAAVTNAPKANADMMLRALKLDTYFEAVVLGDECSRPKPYPDPYQKAMELLGLKPEEVMVIEDSPSGVQAGVAAGAFVVGLTTGQTAAALSKAGASCTLNDFSQLVDLIPSELR